MYNLIAYMPQNATAIYEYEEKKIAISSPFKKFAIAKLSEDFDINNCPAVIVDIRFKNFEDLVTHLKMWHTYEILKNDKTIQLWKDKLAKNSIENERAKKSAKLRRKRQIFMGIRKSKKAGVPNFF